MSDTPRTIEDAETLGYTVDTHCYPHFAYTGPRSMPRESFLVEPERETALRLRAEKAEAELAAARRETAERVRDACREAAGDHECHTWAECCDCRGKIQDAIDALDLSPFTGGVK